MRDGRDAQAARDSRRGAGLWLALLVWAAVPARAAAEPPGVQVTVDGVPVPSVTGSFCWPEPSGPKRCADTVPAPDLVNDQPPIVVPPASSGSIRFEQPPRRFWIKRWVGEAIVDHELGDDGSFVTPSHPGRHIFEIAAEWDAGDAMYAFVVVVEEGPRPEADIRPTGGAAGRP